MVSEFSDQVRFAVENYGDSKLAKKFGVKRYPAIFVDDILVATPKDFGFYGKGEGEGGGRYAPLRSAQSHERFRSDLTKIVRLVIAGKNADARAIAPSPVQTQIAELPQLHLTDLDGKPVTNADLANRRVVVEFWATWCPPCRGTLAWLGDLQKKHKDLAIVTVAIESDAGNVQQMLHELKSPPIAVMGTPDLARAFGDISAVPTLFVFDRGGKTAGVFYGAPPSLHSDVESLLR